MGTSATGFSSGAQTARKAPLSLPRMPHDLHLHQGHREILQWHLPQSKFQTPRPRIGWKSWINGLKDELERRPRTSISRPRPAPIGTPFRVAGGCGFYPSRGRKNQGGCPIFSAEENTRWT